MSKALRGEVFAVLAAIFTVGHFAWMPSGYQPLGITYHYGIINGTVMSPFAQRVLIPLTIAPFTASVWDTVYAQAFTSVVYLVAALLATYAWLRANAISEERALLGIALVAFYTPLWYQAFYGIAYSPLEIVFLASALLCIKRQYYAALIPLIVAGTANRETTGLYIVLLFALWTRGRENVRLLGYVTLFAATYAVIRLLFPGAGSWEYGLSQWITVVVVYLDTSILYNLPFVPLWLIALWRYRAAPADVKRIAPFALVNVGLFLAFGNWEEVRLLMPSALLIALPIVLSRRKPA